MASKILNYKFKPNPNDRRKPNLDPREIRLFPLLPININGFNHEGLLDSGSQTIFIPKRKADALGLKPTGKYIGNGANGSFSYGLVKVSVKIGIGTRSKDFGEIVATVPYDENPAAPILIGINPVFEEFTVIFEKHKCKFQLIPVFHYP